MAEDKQILKPVMDENNTSDEPVMDENKAKPKSNDTEN